MRVWDVGVHDLCRNHLLGEHRELHGLWNILTIHGGIGGYSKHPETKRWIGKKKALYKRHEELVKEMEKRGYSHRSLLEKRLAKGVGIQDEFVNSMTQQRKILLLKSCDCFSKT